MTTAMKRRAMKTHVPRFMGCNGFGVEVGGAVGVGQGSTGWHLETVPYALTLITQGWPYFQPAFLKSCKESIWGKEMRWMIIWALANLRLASFGELVGQRLQIAIV